MNHCEIQFKKIIKEEIDIPSLNFSERKSEEAEEGFEQQAGEKPLTQKQDLEGFFFLPDGRVLVLNNELYEEVIQKGIIIDLKESNSEEEQKEEVEETKENFSFQHQQKLEGRAVSQSQRQKKQ